MRSEGHVRIFDPRIFDGSETVCQRVGRNCRNLGNSNSLPRRKKQPNPCSAHGGTKTEGKLIIGNDSNKAAFKKCSKFDLLFVLIRETRLKLKRT